MLESIYTNEKWDINMTKTEAKLIQSGNYPPLKRDYIPGGKEQKTIVDLKLRQTEEDEVYQCGAITGNDPQSGPIYCGKIADWVDEDGLYCICDYHKRNAIKRVIHKPYKMYRWF